MNKYNVRVQEHDEFIPATVTVTARSVEVTTRGALLFKSGSQLVEGFNDNRWISFKKQVQDD